MQPTERVAIVGMGALFARSSDPERFWELIAAAVDATGEPPAGRWLLEPAEAYDPRVAQPDKVYATRAGFVEPFLLDTEGLDLDPALFSRLDPQFHLALHAARQAWRSFRSEGLDRTRVGVILGNIVLPTETTSRLAREVLGRTFAERLGVADDPPEPIEPLNAFAAGLPAGIVAKALRLGGGTFTLDAACASSLYALKLAADELLAGRADAMLTGGLSRPDPLYTQMGFSQLRALAAGGKPRPFDARGDGLIVGEGAGVFVLKRLSDALRDGDTIHGVIAGAGLSNDVDGGLLAPSSEGQLRAMRTAYERAGWDPRDVDLIECHATGTPVGDAVEVASLSALWGDKGWSPGQCVIGSVKSNVGHALTAAGSAGLLKVLLALRHRMLPPTANFEGTAPNVDLSASPFRVLTEARPWNAPTGRPRRAAISGFGFGGINAHILIEEWNPATVERPVAEMADSPAPIAIVGMAAHVGPFSSLRAVQEHAFAGDAATELAEPRQTWGVETSEWFRAGKPLGGFPRGSFLNEVTLPVDRFRIPPKELEEMLPQQSLMLRVAADAIADGGWDERPRLRAGTFIGIGLDLNTTNFHLRWWVRKRAPQWSRELGLELAPERFDAWVDSLCDAVGPALSANRTMGALGGLIASRIARELRIGGPSFTVSSEETSGTRALAVAARLLQQGELDEAVVGAVDLPGDPRMIVSRAQSETSPQGLGEGAVAFVLKRLDDARRDGNRVYAVLRGFGDGVTGAQQSLAEAGVEASSIGYLHAPADYRSGLAYAAAGSSTGALAPSDSGRVGAASSLVALAKAVLSVYQEFLAPRKSDRTEKATQPPLFAPRAPQYWLRDRDEGPRRALVTSRSVDGNEHHVVLEQADTSTSHDAIEQLQPLGARPAALFVVEADDRAALVQRVVELDALITEHADENVERLARLWWARHPNDPARRLAVTFVAETFEALRSLTATARSFLAGGRPAPPQGTARGLAFSPLLLPAGQAREPLGREGRLAFVYPGLGNLHPGMGRTLSAHWPEIFRRQDAENGTLRSQFAPGAFWNDDPPASFPDHRAPILGQVVVGSLVTDLLQSFGIAPHAAIGYSLGESSALIAMRAWTERDEMLRRLHASPLFHTELAGPCDAARRVWGLAEGQRAEWLAGVVPCSPQAVAAALEGRKRVYRLIVNTPDECVIGGERAAVLRLVEDLGCRLFPLPLVSTVHCEITRVVAHAYRELHVLKTTPPPGVRFYSGAWGHAFVPDSTTAANSILAHATEGIDFPRVIERAYADGVRVFVEVGPGASCTRLIDAILGDRPHLARSACLGGQDEVVTVLDLLARLIAERVHVDLSSLYGRESLVVAHREPQDVNPRRTLTVLTGGRPFVIPPLPISVPAPRQPTIPDRPPPPAEVPPPSPGVAVPAIKPLTPLPVPQLDPDGLQQGLLAGSTARSEAHEAYLGLSTRLSQSMVNQLTFQMALVEALMNDAPPTAWPDRMPRLTGPAPALDRDQCLEFAIGSIAAVLGPEFAPVDGYPTRVRLPDEPLMLVDRIMTIEGEARSMTHGRVVTEHDILPGAWYLDAGRIPPCIAIESGQADLFLSGYLGIDFITRGLAVYRLLDASVTFHRGLPGPGSVIRYDIYIDRFFRQGDTHLFRFRFEAEVDGEPLLSMRDGCAGFFSAEELAAGKGIVSGLLDARPQRGTLPADWTPLVAMDVESYSEDQVDALRRGDLAGAFGRRFENLPLQSPAPLPSGRMTLVDRVLMVDPTGGRYGLGLIRAEADIHPGAWFMVCHFVDDRVMPGTLMYECCLHTLRIYLTRLGWVGEEGEVAWEPKPGVLTRLRCRGQVTESTQKVVYEIAIKELGYGPEPYAIVDTLMYADGRTIVEFANMSLRLTGQTREGLERIWSGAGEAEAAPALYTREQILAFATGKPSEAFGAPYRVFDEERFIARLPAPPYSFLDRVTSVTGGPFEMVAGGIVVTDYDVPPDAWYFAADRQPHMPFAVLLEVALQPCGWMAAYMGSALTSDDALHFRNLGGEAVVLAPVTPESGTLTTTVKVTKVAKSAGMIIQNFDFEVCDCNGPVYRGDTYFGFFRAEALADQVGVREAVPYQPTPEELGRAQSFAFPERAPFPSAELRMMEWVDAFVPDGGPAGLGFIEGSKRVNPDDWFFKAHFYYDPVCPGSLGLESFLQLLKVVADARWGVGPDSVFESTGRNDTHRWVYRGQVIPSCERVTVQAVITAVDDHRRSLKANGFLSVDGRVIYQIIDFTLGLGTESR